MAGSAIGSTNLRPAFLVPVASFLLVWLQLPGWSLHSPGGLPVAPGMGPVRSGPVANTVSHAPVDALMFTRSEPMLTPSTTPTSTSTPVGLVRGHVTWQGSAQPDPRQVQTATIGLCSWPLVGSYDVTTDQNGNFSVVTGLPDGGYSWSFKSFRSLSYAGGLGITGGTTDVVDMNDPTCNCQKAGDADGNNVVSVPDFALMRNTYGKEQGEPGYDRRGDFDNSNRVDISDFLLLKINFGFDGVPGGCPIPR
jgi:hypothetical protein